MTHVGTGNMSARPFAPEFFYTEQIYILYQILCTKRTLWMFCTESGHFTTGGSARALLAVHHEPSVQRNALSVNLTY